MKVKNFIALVVSIMCVSSTFMSLTANADQVKEYDSWKASVLPNYDIGFSISADTSNITDSGSVKVTLTAEKINVDEMGSGGQYSANINSDGVVISNTGTQTNPLLYSLTSTSIQGNLTAESAGGAIAYITLSADGLDSGCYEVYFDIESTGYNIIEEADGYRENVGLSDLMSQTTPYTNSIWLTVESGKITDVSMDEPTEPVIITTTTPVTTPTTTTTTTTTTPPISTTTTTTTTSTAPVSTTTTPVTSTTPKDVSNSSTSTGTSTPGTTTVSGNDVSTTSESGTSSSTSSDKGNGKDNQTTTPTGTNSNNNKSSTKETSDDGGAPGTGDTGIGAVIALLGVSVASILGIKKNK